MLAFCAALAALALGAGTASAKAGLKSELEGTKPAVSGLQLEVVGGDRFLVLKNGSGKQIIVKGYEDEPYLRFLPNRVVQENVRSPSKYANEDRYALTPLPPQANSDAAPKWRTVSSNGSYRWFDHRIHSMEKGTPPQVKDKDVRTKIFDWSVPMTVNGAQVRALGTLEWLPDESSGTSTGLVVALGAALVLALAALAFLLIRRRPRPASAAGTPKVADEAW